MQPRINLLIRNKYRPELFRRCLDTIERQTYSNIHLIIGCDSPESEDDALTNTTLRFSTEIVRLAPGTEPFFWNIYCNTLKDRVTDGWFNVLDNDDYLVDEYCIEKLAQHLTDPSVGVICQFLRNGKPKPNNRLIRRGEIKRFFIGGGAIVLHARNKYVSDWDGHKAADFRFIEAVSKMIQMKFIPLVVQVAGNNGLRGA